MEHLFFNYDGTLESVADRIFPALGLTGYLHGDSLNVLGGKYVSIGMLGLVLKLESNAYDYEDKYLFMMTVKKDPCNNLIVSDSTVGTFARIVARLLADNAQIDVALETEKGLENFASVK